MPRSPQYKDPTNNINNVHFSTIASDACEPISREEEDRLFRAYKAGDMDALERIASSNLRFALQIARNTSGGGLPLDDLVCAANMGLLTAAQKFDPDRGHKFISYAVWWIRQSVNKEIADNRRNIRINALACCQVARQSRIRGELMQQLGRDPNTTEILDEYEKQYGLIPMHWEDVQVQYGGTISLDEILNDDGHPLNGHGVLADENVADPLDAYQAEAAQAAIEDALRQLSEREADIIALYYGLLGTAPLTLEEIGERHNITRERVRQLRNKALDTLRRRCPKLGAYLPEP